MRSRFGNRGFTLIELLVAISIFAVIGSISWSMLRTTATYSQRLEASAEELFSIQKALWILSRDLQQIARRPIRDAVGELEAEITSLVPGETLSFTKSQDMSLPGHPALQLQRVSYRLDSSDGSPALYRDIWPVLDRDTQTEPQSQMLLDDLSSLSLRFVDSSGQTLAYWPSNPGVEGTPIDSIPAAIYLQVETSRFGVIERLIPIFPIRAVNQ